MDSIKALHKKVSPRFLLQISLKWFGILTHNFTHLINVSIYVYLPNKI